MEKYQLIYSKRKTIALQVKRDGSVVVRAPMGYPKASIERFVASRAQWIENAKKQVKSATVFPRDEEEIRRLKELAAKVIPQKVKEYSVIMGLSPKSVRIGSARGRFGSCSSAGALNFSCFLMLYPESAIDYVVVHELAHLKCKGHDKRFYALVARYLPDYKEREALLKQ